MPRNPVCLDSDPYGPSATLTIFLREEPDEEEEEDEEEHDDGEEGDDGDDGYSE